MDHPRCSRVLGSTSGIYLEENDGYLNFNAISVYKVYIDFWITILDQYQKFVKVLGKC